ncbi:SEC-C domain-containing protein [Candidatus Sumerlaeota bacterium]|nr:SEC-C domain-containing protein [Candidatus Sumerlaeota bacterium]
MAQIGTPGKPIILRVRTLERAEEVASICEDHGWKYIIGLEDDKPEDISDLERLLNSPAAAGSGRKVGRNDPCPCGSGKKYKKCCGRLAE